MLKYLSDTKAMVKMREKKRASESATVRTGSWTRQNSSRSRPVVTATCTLASASERPRRSTSFPSSALLPPPPPPGAMGYTKEQLLARLQELKIDFTCYDHPVVLTVEEQKKYVGHLGGALSKNLLLKDKKHRLYIVSALEDTKVDMKILSQRLGLGKSGLRMAPEENLLQVLQVPLGCVTPFALINDSASGVSLLLDQGFKSKQSCYFHPLTNVVTIALDSSNLDKFLISIGKQPAYVDLEASPVVGKDNPPDLAHLVPSDVPISSEQPVQNVTPASVTHQNNTPKETGKAKPKVQGKSAGNSQSKVDKPSSATSVEKCVNDVFDTFMSPLFLSEVSKKLNLSTEELSSKLDFDGLRGLVAPELESVMMIMKNASYTAGFEAGFETMLNSGLKGRPSPK